MQRKIFFLLTSFFLFTILNSMNLQAQTPGEQENNNQIQLLTDAKSGILIEYHTGKVLYEHNARERRSPASMTKIMSILLVTEAIDQGRLNWTDIITVSEHASSYGGSQIFLAHNEKMSVEDLYKGMVIASGNDATVALAETVAGSEEHFVQMMNDKVKALGLEDTHFMDPTGLTDFDEGHYSTAHDMAKLSQHLLINYGDTVLKYSSIYEDYLRKGSEREFWLVNTNKLVRHITGVDGLKTGWTSESGYNLTATMKKDDMRLISVVMGNSTPTARSADTMRLFNYGYSMFTTKEYKPEGFIIGNFKSMYLKPRDVQVVTKMPIHFVVKKGTELKGYTEQYDYQVMKGKINPGDVVGKLQVLDQGKVVAEVELTVNTPVDQVNFFELFGRTTGKTLLG